jgi:hypothetical protein
MITVHKRLINDMTIYAYNDSGAQWVVNSLDSEHREMRFDRRKFTLKHAMQFYAELQTNPATDGYHNRSRAT